MSDCRIVDIEYSFDEVAIGSMKEKISVELFFYTFLIVCVFPKFLKFDHKRILYFTIRFTKVERKILFESFDKINRIVLSY